MAGTRKEDDDDALPKDPPPPAPSRFAAAVQESVAAAQDDGERCAQPLLCFLIRWIINTKRRFCSSASSSGISNRLFYACSNYMWIHRDDQIAAEFCTALI